VPSAGPHPELSPDEFAAAVAAVTTAFGDPTRRDIYLFVRARETGATAAEVESLCEAGEPSEPSEPTGEPSVEQQVRRIERAIAAREEAREIALAAGESDLLELLN